METKKKGGSLTLAARCAKGVGLEPRVVADATVKTTMLVPGTEGSTSTIV
jgi:hypothetical protein